MALIRDLPLEPLVKRWFSDEQLKTSEELWRAIGPRYEEGMARLEGRTRIARDRLVRALGAAADAGPRHRFSLGEALLATTSIALLALAGLRTGEALHAITFPVPGLTAEVYQAVIVPHEGLSAFHILTESDLCLVSRPRSAGGITRKAEAVSRYLLRPKAGGSIVQPGDLGPVSLEADALAERWIVTLHIDPSGLGPEVALGDEAMLLLSAKKGAAPAAVETMIRVLAIDRGTGTGPSAVTVAIARDEQARVAAALGTSSIFFGRVDRRP
jgi:hypothetical protein